jgi:hypothetical protein
MVIQVNTTLIQGRKLTPLQGFSVTDMTRGNNGRPGVGQLNDSLANQWHCGSHETVLTLFLAFYPCDVMTAGTRPTFVSQHGLKLVISAVVGTDVYAANHNV